LPGHSLEGATKESKRRLDIIEVTQVIGGFELRPNVFNGSGWGGSWTDKGKGVKRIPFVDRIVSLSLPRTK